MYLQANIYVDDDDNDNDNDNDDDDDNDGNDATADDDDADADSDADDDHDDDGINVICRCLMVKDGHLSFACGTGQATMSLEWWLDVTRWSIPWNR